LEILNSNSFVITTRTSGNIILQIGNSSFALESSDLDWYNTEKIYLEKGIHNLNITANENSSLDAIFIWSAQDNINSIQDFFNFDEKPIVSIRLKNDDDITKKIFYVNTTKPFMFSFSEFYDDSWIALINGKKIETLPLYSIINGVWVNESGEFEIVLEFETQKWFISGLSLTILTAIIIYFYFFYEYCKKKKEKCFSKKRESF